MPEIELHTFIKKGLVEPKKYTLDEVTHFYLRHAEEQARKGTIGFVSTYHPEVIHIKRFNLGDLDEIPKATHILLNSHKGIVLFPEEKRNEFIELHKEVKKILDAEYEREKKGK